MKKIFSSIFQNAGVGFFVAGISQLFGNSLYATISMITLGVVTTIISVVIEIGGKK